MINRRISLGIGLTGAVSSLALFTSLFDPFAAAKTFVIINLAFFLFGYSGLEIFKSRIKNLEKISKYFVILTIVFIGVFVIRALTSPDVNLALHGVVGRNSGALTYVGYGLLFIVALCFVTVKDFSLILKSLELAGLVAGFYSLLEYLKLDPWKMRSVYNATSGLLGNPNFSGAFLSLTGIVSLWALVQKRETKTYLVSLPTFALSLFGVYTSKALQGVISLAIGFSVIFLMWLRNRNASLSKIGFLGFGLLGVAGILGALQIGPLSSFLYKGSVSERGDMWRTAFSMIKAHPMWGIGIERYGVDFRQYRDKVQALRAGPDVFSDNAHNVLLHLSSTGGVLLGALYLIITLSILSYGTKSLLTSSGSKQAALTIALALWIPIQAQNTISVDNAGVFVWSWILGGAIVAISRNSDFIEESKKKKNQIESIHAMAPVIALLCVIASVGLTIKPVVAQRDFSFAFYLGTDPNIPSTLSNKVNYLIKAENQDPGNVTWPRYSANSLYIDKAWKDSIDAAQRAVTKDPTDWVAWWFMASAYEQSEQFKEAIPARLKTVELDPFNTSVLLELAKDQKAIGDVAGLQKTKLRILSVNPDGPDAQAVSTL